ncbi:SufD family Fe-S cluster assembly protein [Novosphingobium sp. TH158]|uniref:SufD family Fe-S cluster assembly protein n=1 Tax=Novosphingobium sp. TH158 TaxID=2067455 RepID=UPI000C7E600A|nr:SufD family Fe-S cluster assembly protein [Novosphingobium sp. TH158]PLK27255.1 Fe-S cluster assembly protein SufD [Novosphingobium sp. TH158]
MTQAVALPSHRDEDFRYADLDALAGIWPVAREEIRIAAGESGALAIVLDGAEATARHLHIEIADGASFDLRVLNTGSGFARIAVDAKLGAKSEFTLGAAQLGGGKANLELVTEVAHLSADSISRQVVRSVLGGEAVGTYLGKVAVARGADGTDAEQSVRAMLLDRTATANARPELEIFADDVKCAHGCAVGELDANALFYMAQRGLPPETAKRLMLQAFVAEAFVGAADEEALDAASQAALEALL